MTLSRCFIGILLIAIHSCSQNDKTRACGDHQPTAFGSSGTSKPLFPYLARWVDWGSKEEQVPAAQRQHFMDTVYWYNSLYGREGNTDFIHVMDLNADGVVDYLYYGPGPGFDTKEMITVIRINDAALSVLGTMKALDFEQGVLKRIYLEQSDNTESTHIKRHIAYEIEHKDGKQKLQKIFQSEMFDNTELPEMLHDKYFLKTFCTDSIVLYSRPGSIESTFGEPRPTAQALVLGEKIDVNKKWLFIAVAPITNAMNRSDSSYQVGWTLNQ